MTRRIAAQAAPLALLAIFAAGCAPGVMVPGARSTGSGESLRVAPPCRTDDVQPNVFLQGATGKNLGGITLRVVGSQRCSLFPGPPRISLSGAPNPAGLRVHRMRPSRRDREARPLRALRALRPGDRAVVELVWSNWCGPPRQTLVVKLRFGGTYRLHLPSVPRCDARAQPSRLDVGPVVPVR